MKFRLWNKSRNPSAIGENPSQPCIYEDHDQNSELSEESKSLNQTISSNHPQHEHVPENSDKVNLCELCGACCAFFRVSFPTVETDISTGGLVPIDLTTPLSETVSYMNGTNDYSSRCTALHGKVGFQVACSIYEYRPSCCRLFFRSWENDTGNKMCDKARAAWGMEPFTRF